MATYFFDTSALVKRHIAEPGHAWVASVCEPANGNTIVIAEVALVEVVASLSRMVRERPQRLDALSRDQLITYFEALAQSEYTITQVNRAVLARAAGLCPKHPLRAYDAIQLACALTRRDDDVAASQPAPIFVCADAMLLKVASAEGLATENPNDHP
ncbi:MAG TPA: type II toxin-antitoxin system VapC family toxin [Ktedonobacterales bacterium]|nr:type II toxin-antitoxin system VapC family toxin [Ktedonobacterales bacterium]